MAPKVAPCEAKNEIHGNSVSGVTQIGQCEQVVRQLDVEVQLVEADLGPLAFRVDLGHALPDGDDPAAHLADLEAQEKFGDNFPAEKRAVTYCELVKRGLVEDAMMQVLCVASVVSIVLGVYVEGPATGWYEGVAILLAVAIVLNVGATNDIQKEKQFRELNGKNEEREVTVFRDGKMSRLMVHHLLDLGASGHTRLPAQAVSTSSVA